MVISAPDTNDIALEAELLDPAGGAHLRLRFSGPFEGKNVTWDATFATLESLRAEYAPNYPLRNFIDIGDENTHGITLTVGLDVACIDIPTIRKVMMMVRQYKRLSRGRHEFGRAIAPSTP